MHSALYPGWLSHRRHAPVRHEFRYGLFMVMLDLSELDSVFRRRWLWSCTRPALARFRRADHLGDPAAPLDACVRSLVERETGSRPMGRIQLLTHLRYFGYVFNPVSFYFCRGTGGTVQAIVAEVNNTPWGERHCYVLRPQAEGDWLVARSAKAMHVSPFHPMALEYEWRFRLDDPGELRIAMALRPKGEPAAAPLFDAFTSLRRVPVTAGSLAGTLVRFPLMTLKVIAAIHWEALRLWLKRVPVHDHPARRATEPAALTSETLQ